MERTPNDLDRTVGQFYSRTPLCNCQLRKQHDWSKESVTFATVAMGGILLTGCEPGPFPPLGFGPQLDGLAGILFTLFAVVLLCYFAKSSVKGRLRRDDSEGIVRERYARGEISHDEYEK